MQSILTLAMSFYTITMNFVLALSLFVTSFNSLMLVTCEFSKRITLISKNIK